MEEKQFSKGHLVIGLCLLIGILACQKKEKKKIAPIDDSNSQFAGKNCYGDPIEEQYVLKWSNGDYSLYTGSKKDLINFIDSQYSTEKTRLESVEQNRKFELDEKNQELMSESALALQNKNSDWYTWGQEDIQVKELWKKNMMGSGISVAVLDGGIDLDHPNLINRILVNENEIPDNGFDDDKNGLVDDYKGFDFSSKKSMPIVSPHGTHVAGIIASESTDSPMFGIAPESKLIPISIFGGKEEGTLLTVLYALKYAESRGAKIVNASWGGPICSNLLKEAITMLGNKDILFINASGNSGLDIEIFPEYPAFFNLSNQITVGATMPSGLMAAFSNYGYSRVHVLAPGYQILSTISKGWAVNSGTSMATPFVSGLAALLWGSHPEAKSSQIKKAIIESTRDPKPFNPVVSKGRINGLVALEKLEKLLNNSKTEP